MLLKHRLPSNYMIEEHGVPTDVTYVQSNFVKSESLGLKYWLPDDKRPPPPQHSTLIV